jgi:hypothetical protein
MKLTYNHENNTASSFIRNDTQLYSEGVIYGRHSILGFFFVSLPVYNNESLSLEVREDHSL